MIGFWPSEWSNRAHLLPSASPLLLPVCLAVTLFLTTSCFAGKSSVITIVYSSDELGYLEPCG